MTGSLKNTGLTLSQLRPPPQRQGEWKVNLRQETQEIEIKVQRKGRGKGWDKGKKGNEMRRDE